MDRFRLCICSITSIQYNIAIIFVTANTRRLFSRIFSRIYNAGSYFQKFSGEPPLPIVKQRDAAPKVKVSFCAAACLRLIKHSASQKKYSVLTQKYGSVTLHPKSRLISAPPLVCGSSNIVLRRK
ncbi:MAG: hypothetical protein ACI4T6_11120, partial [Candidatus Flemingiibacterium sp.]